jgi:DNA-directed RNA polymerase specialized sigma24 family protein
LSADDTDLHLSQLATHWSLLWQAHAGEAGAAQSARAALLQRYGGAVYRYLFAVARDPDVAQDLAQEFALRFLRGDLRKADPSRGRFRDLVKVVLLHLVADYFRARQHPPAPLPDDSSVMPATPPDQEATEREFVRLWRAELIDRTWEALHADGDRQPHYDVLRWRVDHPGQTADEAAAELGPRQGMPLTAVYYRQLLHRARRRFAELLFDEVARSLDTSDRDQVVQELADLELLVYCRPVLGS